MKYSDGYDDEEYEYDNCVAAGKRKLTECQAEIEVDRLKKVRGINLSYYQCNFCHSYHLTKKRQRKSRRKK